MKKNGKNVKIEKSRKNSMPIKGSFEWNCPRIKDCITFWPVLTPVTFLKITAGMLFSARNLISRLKNFSAWCAKTLKSRFWENFHVGISFITSVWEKNRKGKALLQARRPKVFGRVRVTLAARRAQQEGRVRDKRRAGKRGGGRSGKIQRRLHVKVPVEQQDSQVPDQLSQHIMRLKEKAAQGQVKGTEEQEFAEQV